MSTLLINNNITEVEKEDILELESRIKRYKAGLEDEERFKLYRLTRGVYGQRQLGVQMFRIKLPLGRVNSEQLICIANVSDKYATGNLHITTRQDIQLHYVRLEDSPKIWIDLADKKVTARESCGNTVRNITTSAIAGIDPDEPFDVTPYAQSVASYFLRNPICQEMGRKIKPAFSSSEKDTVLTFINDFGFIPRIVEGERGFKVVLGGGLGAQAISAVTAFEFLTVDQIIPFMEAALRVFDRHGEREKRHKARLKYLINNLGLEVFLKLVEKEKRANNTTPPLNDIQYWTEAKKQVYFSSKNVKINNKKKYHKWLRTNTFEQKQKDRYGVFIKVFLGDLSSEKARSLAAIVSKYATDDIRFTINQNVLIRDIFKDHLPELFVALDEFGLAEPGYNTITDITSCPGTDTCNLGVTNSTALTFELEKYLNDNYAELLEDSHIKIKISGCMNACGQHTIGNIGFHGSSLKRDGKVIPAMQVLLGGGVDPYGQSYIADKITKIPTKRIPHVIGIVLDHFISNKLEGEYFNHYYLRMGGRKYFYQLIKHFTDISNIDASDLMDWGQEHLYKQEIGIGECAGVILDLVGTLIMDAKEKLEKAHSALVKNDFSGAIFYAYSSFVVGAKAVLLSEGVECNTHKKIIYDFQIKLVQLGRIDLPYNFETKVLSINEYQPTDVFAKTYVDDADTFLENIIAFTNSSQEALDKEVITNFYTA